MNVSNAQTQWNYDGSSNWGTAANWNPPAIPLSNTPTVFGSVITSNATVDLEGNTYDAQSLSFSNANTYTLTNGTIHLFSNGISFSQNGGGNVQIATTINFQSNATFSGAGTGIVSFNDPITESGIRSVTKTGASTMIFNGSNSYSGGTILTAGTLGAGNDSAFGTGFLRLNGGTLRGEGGTRALSNSLEITANSIIDGANQITFSSNVTHSTGSRTLTVSNTALTIFNGNTLTLAENNQARTLSISVAGASAGVVISNQIVNGTGTGADGLTKLGTGRLSLFGSNTFTGTMTVSAGTLGVGHDQALGAGTVSLGTATLRAEGGDRLIGNALTLAGNTTFGAAGFTNGFTFTNTATLTGNRILSIFSNTLVIVSNTIGQSGGARSLTKSGAGTLRLLSSNSYSGGTILSQGTLGFGLAEAIGTGAFTFNGGILLPEANNMTVTNAININNSSIISGNSNITFSGNVLHQTGNRTLTISNTGTTLFNGPTLTLAENNQTRTLTINVATGAGIVTISNRIQNGTGSGSDGLTKSGAGSLLLHGSNTYSGNTTLTAGLLGVGNSNAMGAGTLVLNGGNLRAETNNLILTNAVTINASSIISGNSNVTFSGNVLQQGGSRTLTISNTGTTVFNGMNFVLAENNQTRTLTVNVAAGAGDVSISNNISNGAGTGADALTKSGAGTLSLSGSNTFTGTLTLSAGTLGLGSDQAAGAGILSLGAATVRAEGADRTIGNAVTLAGNTTFGATGYTHALIFTNTANLNGSRTLSVFTGATVTFSNTITQSGGTRSITKTGNGTLRLMSSNNFGGGTILTAGTLGAGHSNALGGGTLTLNGGNLRAEASNLVLTNAITLSNSSAITGTNNLILSGNIQHLAGNRTLSISNTGTTIFNGTNLVLAEANQTRNLTVNVMSGAGQVTISNTIQDGTGTGADGLTKTGGGTLVLSGSSSNTFTGTTAVNGGTLVLAKSNNTAAISTNLTISNASVRLGANQQMLTNSSINMFSTSTLDLNGFSQTNNSLTFSANDIVIDFGNGGGTTNIFMARQFNPGSFSFSVWNWSGSLGETNGLDRFYVTNNLGLLSGVNFYSDSGTTLIGGGYYAETRLVAAGLYELIPVPEPSPVLLLIGAGLLAVFLRNRHFPRRSPHK
ncbi:autotransporter-associated beta strand repeat-containing protein [Kamptonema cortianum]|nr:autotransporter-associated beta strand repeat-containing protein [Oscillatoria laete-virens]MDK3157140.1 autotransporter-associated beta strand repeat-containing protein [Kamptonema cortianum]MDL5055023.1 autotransporter-associated beta strand repeat-containing protein [Oscillatoria laete-virens NRMC-F 0139]